MENREEREREIDTGVERNPKEEEREGGAKKARVRGCHVNDLQVGTQNVRGSCTAGVEGAGEKQTGALRRISEGRELDSPPLMCLQGHSNNCNYFYFYFFLVATQGFSE